MVLVLRAFAVLALAFAVAPLDTLAACIAEPANAVAWYRAEGNYRDSRGSHHATGGGTFVAGRVGQAFSFNGTSNYAVVPDSAGIEPASLTIEAWVRFSSVPTTAMIVSKPLGSGTANSYSLFLDAGKIASEISNDIVRPRAQAAWSPVPGTWYHLATTFDGATQMLRTYVDGLEVASASAGIPLTYDGNSLYVGAELDNLSLAYFFPGLIDEVTLYARSLPSSEIAAIAAAGADGKCAPGTVYTTADSGNGSLRDAISYYNARCDFATANTISFGIPGAGPHQISPASELPALACPHTALDGYTQPGSVAGAVASRDLRVILSGASCAGCSGLKVLETNVSVKGLAIHSFPAAGILANLAGTSYIVGNYIGTDPGGTSAGLGNVKGVHVAGGTVQLGSAGDATQANLITGNAVAGVYVSQPLVAMREKVATTSIVRAYLNRIGGDRSGSTAIGNGGPGVYFENAQPDIGYSSYFEENTVIANNGPGIQSAAGHWLQLRANRIYQNLGFTALDLGTDGPTANDVGDSDGIPNKPQILSVSYETAVSGTCSVAPCTHVSARVQSAYPGSLNTVRFDFFLNGSPPAVPQGEFYMGFADSTLDTSGQATVNVTFAGITAQNVVATASYSTCGIECPARTSEYSMPLPLPPGVSATFSAPTAYVGNVVKMNIAVSNPNAADSMTSFGFTFAAPANLKVVGAMPLGDCSPGGSYSNTSTTATFGGPPIPPGGTCTFEVSLVPEQAAIYGHAAGSLSVSSSLGSATNSNTSSVNVSLVSPGFGFSGMGTITPGVPVAFGMLVTRMAAHPTYSDIGFTITLPAGVTVAPAPNIVPGCSGGSVAATAGGNTIAVAGKSLLVTGACELFRVDVVFSSAGSHTFTLPANSATWRPGSASNTFLFTVPISNTVTATGVPAVSLSATSLAFGNQESGTLSTAQLLTITNSGSADLVLSSVAATGEFGFSNGSPACTGPSPVTIPAGSNCSIGVHFAPLGAGAETGTIQVTHNASGSPHVVTLGGTGTQAMASISPSPGAFGSVPVGTTATLALTVTNTGTAPLDVASAVISGAPFAIAGDNCGQSVPPGSTCQINATFSPGAAGAQSGSMTVTSDASNSPTVVSLTGTGTAPGVSLAPSPVAFGNVPVGGSASRTLTLQNTGTAPLAINGISVTGSFFSRTTSCGTSLAAGASCPIVVGYSPGAAGSHTGELSVSTNAGPSPVVAPLSGTGVVPSVLLSATSLSFGNQTLNTPSASQSVTVTNNGGADLMITSITVSGDFGFSGCPTPITLVAGASCTLGVTFLPTGVGPRTGGIAIASNAGGSPHGISLSGNGTPAPMPAIALTPASASFSAQVGQAASQSFALSNTGNANLAISGIAIGAPQAAAAKAVSFTQSNNCPASLAPSAACNIVVTYAPTAPGSESAELQVFSNAVPSPKTAALSGTATAGAAVSLSPAAVAFPPQFVGTRSGVQSVTLANAGTGPLNLTLVASAGDFGYSGCGYPMTLAPGASCSFDITFRPLSEGAHAGSIAITSNAPGSPHAIALSGTGVSLLAPQINLSPSSLGFGTVRNGRSATLTMRLGNSGAAPLAISSIGGGGAFFSAGHNCPPSLPVGGACDITVTYAPTATGAHSGQVVIHSNAIPSPHIAALSGTGQAVPPPFLAVDAAVAFGPQVLATTTRRTLTLANTGGDPLRITALEIAGTGAAAFNVTGACDVIAPEATCDLALSFTPTALEPFSARLDIVSNHSGGVVRVQLSGTGVPTPRPELEISVGGLGFGNQALGTSGEPRTFVVTSVGQVAARIFRFDAPPDYAVSSAQCPAVLLPRASCEVSVTFRPVATGPRVGRLSIESDAVNNPASVSLTGVGCRFFSLGGSRNPTRLCAP